MEWEWLTECKRRGKNIVLSQYLDKENSDAYISLGFCYYNKTQELGNHIKNWLILTRGCGSTRLRNHIW
jgi:hypothetical protein